MGGTLEFINASIPSVLWPHFADQHDLAVIMEKKGIGKILQLQVPATSQKHVLIKST